MKRTIAFYVVVAVLGVLSGSTVVAALLGAVAGGGIIVVLTHRAVDELKKALEDLAAAHASMVDTCKAWQALWDARDEEDAAADDAARRLARIVRQRPQG